MKLTFGENMSNRFEMGSNYFFGCYSDFSSKDIDYIYFVEKPKLFRKCMTMRNNAPIKEDIFFWKKLSPQEYVNELLETDTPMQAGKFLVKEICDYIGFKIEHLKQIKSVFERMDEKHSYEKSIYESYIQNGNFTLSDEQRNKAYNIYKNTHNK